MGTTGGPMELVFLVELAVTAVWHLQNNPAVTQNIARVLVANFYNIHDHTLFLS